MVDPKEGLWKFEHLSHYSHSPERWESCGSGSVTAQSITDHLAYQWEIQTVVALKGAAYVIIVIGKNHLKGESRMFTRLW